VTSALRVATGCLSRPGDAFTPGRRVHAAPSENAIFIVPSALSTGFLTISAAGAVQPANSANTYLNCSFSPA
jgi:hypothetical protein